ncbi:hypothetical protein AB0L00_38520 [Actinoallomurus sp. NPDC052308]|uniref:alcohol dehydrogenase catalytic domain-containing protein n=1 Tax=Actinoallomurus sp. NPDC052308 TaxID=3155530 RepID=UPI00342C7425
MRVVRYDRFGGIEQLWIDEMPTPEAASGHAVVRVQASCINPGSLSALHGSPYVPIRDLAGTVTAVGADVHDVKVGDDVLGWSQDWSAHAEFVAVPAEQLVAKPALLSWDVAGSLYVTPMAGLAGVQAVEPGEGEVVVISGASGGVGLTAAQLARRRGATVIGIAGQANAGRLREHGVVPVSYGGPAADRAYPQFIVTIRHQNRSAPAHRRLGHGARPRRRSAAKWPRPCSRTRPARPQADLETARQAPAELSDQPE